MVFERKRVIKRYLLFWFILDLIGIIPCSLLKYTSKGSVNLEDTESIANFTFITFPRVYTVCLGFKLCRIRKSEQIMRRILKQTGVGVDKSNLVVTIWNLVLILHLVANFWGVSASFNTDSSDNWLAFNGIQDATVV